MATGRKDAWTTKEDRLLAEMVLEHTRSGSTQLKAFEESGRKLTRTAAACGFRWNSFVRKKYKNEISEAKESRKAQPKQTQKEEIPERQAVPAANANRFSAQEMIQFLLKMEEAQSNIYTVTDDKLKREMEELKNQLAKANNQLKKLRNEYSRLKHDYESLLGILEKAREMAALKGAEAEKETAT